MSKARKAPESYTGLPYINNFKAIAITGAINLAMAFIFQFGREITLYAFLIDAAICAAVTSIINILLTKSAVDKLRATGGLPAEVPSSTLMQRLPLNPILLIPIFSVVFAAIMVVFSFVVVRFFEIDTYPFYRFVVWKLVYSTVLSAKIYEMAIFRYVQPDCTKDSDPQQTGLEAVKNPLPRANIFKTMFDTVINDFGFNLLVGLLVGGTIISGHDVIIPATTRSGIVVGGLILGIIVTFRLVMPTAAQIRSIRDAGGLPLFETRTWVARLPEKPFLFALALLVPIMIVSATVLWAALTFFGFETLSFFQYFIVRTVYVFLLSKPVAALAVSRYRQPA